MLNTQPPRSLPLMTCLAIRRTSKVLISSHRVGRCRGKVRCLRCLVLATPPTLAPLAISRVCRSPPLTSLAVARKNHNNHPLCKTKASFHHLRRSV